MSQIVINLIFSIVSSATIRELIEKGLRKLVESTDNGIDNNLLDIILSEATKSTWNELTESKVNEIKEKYNIK